MADADVPRQSEVPRPDSTAGRDAGGGSGDRRRGLIGSVINRVAPTVIDNVDLDRVLESVDVNEVARRLDLDALIDRLDVNAIAERLDLDVLVQRLDLDAVAARVDLNALVDRLDVDAVATRLDLDALVDRMDVDAVAARLDVDALVDRIDVDAVAARLDMGALIERIDVAQLTAGASQDFALSGLDLARRQVIRADATVESFVDRTLRRRAGPRPDAPTWLAEAAAAGETDPVPVTTETTPSPADLPPRRQTVSGHFAGPVSRILTVALDLAGSFTVYGFLAAAATYLIGAFTPATVELDAPAAVAAVTGTLWLVLWLAVPVALFGRTPAMALVGLAVVPRTGTVVGAGRALVRALVEPVAVALPVVGFAGVFVGRERRALHDLAAGTVVVYDWGVREAQRPVTVREFLSARVRRVEPGS